MKEMIFNNETKITSYAGNRYQLLRILVVLAFQVSPLQMVSLLNANLCILQLAFPFAHYACGQCIAQYIGSGTKHIAKMIDRQY